jgi:hypothetical protein
MATASVISFPAELQDLPSIDPIHNKNECFIHKCAACGMEWCCGSWACWRPRLILCSPCKDKSMPPFGRFECQHCGASGPEETAIPAFVGGLIVLRCPAKGCGRLL